MEERDYTVPLRRGFQRTPRYERAKRALSVLRAFLERHCKAEVRIGQHLNEEIWAKGIRNPPPRVKVHCWIDEKNGKRVANVEIQGKPFKESVRPEEKAEEATGLKGKLQQATQVLSGKKSDKTAEKDAETADAGEEEAAKPKKIPAKTTVPERAAKAVE